MQEWTFYFETFGCKVNQYETQALREAWQGRGGREVTDASQADYICINSCAITARAERDARNAVYRLRRQAPGAKIILCGCAAQFFPDFKPRKRAWWNPPDLCIEQKDKKILLAGPMPAEKPDGKQNDYHISDYVRGRAIVKIQDGCTQNCTYCIVPQTRGKPVSRAPELIEKECRALFEHGFSEIVISGVNLKQYGIDRPQYGDFWDLLRYLDKNLSADFSGSGRIRISSIEPGQLNDKALELLGNSDLFCPHLHLSLQHASQPILRRMGRGHYSAEKIFLFIEELKKAVPVLGLGADIIVGFPGETETDVDLLAQFIQALPLTYAHVFPYSQRPGTAAANFDNQIDKKIKLARAERIRSIAALLARDFWSLLLDRPLTYIAADSNIRAENNLCHGVNEFYAPCFFAAAAPPSGLLPAKPTGLGAKGLFVNLLANID